MKCPNCGEEITQVVERGNNLIEYESYYNEASEGRFDFYEQQNLDIVSSQTDEVVCPKCRKSLKYHFEEQQMVIEE